MTGRALTVWATNFPPQPQGQKTVYSRQKPDYAAELEKLVLEQRGWGRGLLRPQGSCLLPGSCSYQPSRPWPARGVLGGPFSSHWVLTKATEQLPLKDWHSWELLGRGSSCGRVGRREHKRSQTQRGLRERG